jgi:hypothetical protein
VYSLDAMRWRAMQVSFFAQYGCLRKPDPIFCARNNTDSEAFRKKRKSSVRSVKSVYQNVAISVLEKVMFCAAFTLAPKNHKALQQR